MSWHVGKDALYVRRSISLVRSAGCIEFNGIGESKVYKVRLGEPYLKTVEGKDEHFAANVEDYSLVNAVVVC